MYAPSDHLETSAAAIMPADKKCSVGPIIPHLESQQAANSGEPGHVLRVRLEFLALILDAPLRECTHVESLRERRYYKSSKDVGARLMNRKFEQDRNSSFSSSPCAVVTLPSQGREFN